MLIANNGTFAMFVSDYGKANSLLQSSMARLASGQRFASPGEAPADVGISEKFKAQIRNSEEAGRVIQNGVNLFTTADSWLQQVQDMLGRMSELAISAQDGSKNQSDRGNLELEFQQLKDEIARISERGKYNGIATNNKTAVAVYDFKQNKIVYSQPDGRDERTLDINLGPGNASQNGIDYNFVSQASADGNYVGDFIFTQDGKKLIYFDQSDRQHINRLDLETDNLMQSPELNFASGTISGETAAEKPTLKMDEEGRIWVTTAAAASSSNTQPFRIGLLDVESMRVDYGGSSTSSWGGASGDTASGLGEFAVDNDKLYYIKSEDIPADTLDKSRGTSLELTDMVYTLSDSLEMQQGEFTLRNNTAVANGLYVYGTASNYALAFVSDVYSASSNPDIISASVANFNFNLTATSIWQDIRDEKKGNTSFNAASATEVKIFRSTDGGAIFTGINTADANEVVLDATGTILINSTNIPTLASTDQFIFVAAGMAQSNKIVFEAVAAAAVDLVQYTSRDRYQYVSQNIFDSSEVKVLIDDLHMENIAERLPTDTGNRPVSTYAVSQDGQYLAYESDDGEITILNTDTGLRTSIVSVASNVANLNSINALKFDTNNSLYFTNTGSADNRNNISKIQVSYGNIPKLGSIEVLKQGNVGTLGTVNYGTISSLDEQGRGLSVGGGSPAANFIFQIGPDKGMDISFVSADSSMVRLGVSRLSVASQEKASEAVRALQNAIDKVSNERAVLGSQVSRLNFVYTANASYADNIVQAESRIRDVDFAKETSLMAKGQVLAQSSIQILQQYNSTKQLVLRLLQ